MGYLKFIILFVVTMSIVGNTTARSCFCTGDMGSVDERITTACCSSKGGVMFLDMCDVNLSSEGFTNCCKATGAYGGGCI